MDKTQYLDSLRKAAKLHDWGQCREVTLNLFQQMPKSVCSNIAVAYAEDYLPKFSQHHPSEDWPRVRLTQIKNAISANRKPEGWPNAVPEWDNRYDSPGDNNFSSVIGVLWRIVVYWDSDQEVADLARNAISGVFMATMVEEWGMKNPGLWERLQNPLDHEDQFILALYFRPSSIFKERSTSLWLDLADRIARGIGTI